MFEKFFKQLRSKYSTNSAHVYQYGNCTELVYALLITTNY